MTRLPSRKVARSPILRRAAPSLAGALSALGLLDLAPALLGEARALADDAAPIAQATPAPAPGSGPACAIEGTHAVAKGVPIFDHASGGRMIATFTGADVPLRLSDFPADPVTGRTRLRVGKSALRIDGFVSGASIATFTARDLPAIGAQVWITSAQSVRVVQAAPGQLTVERTILGSPGQTVRASASCDALSLQQGTPQAMDVPGNGRGYTMKAAQVDLLDAPGGKVVFTLQATEGASHLFWSTETRGAFVHVRSRADVAVDAWAPLRQLDPLKRGEMMDAFNPGTTTSASAHLALDRPPRVIQLAREAPVRARRDEKEPPIGAIEAGGEVYLVETVADWANVLPKDLGVMPPDDGGFWIPVSEVPK